MAKKYELITELYERTRQSVTEPQQWQRFLSTVCRNYRLSFDEQLLLFAQRPDATAVLEIEKWNRQFGRWVNRGATGIAVFNTDTTSRVRLKYYFDVSGSMRAPSRMRWRTALANWKTSYLLRRRCSPQQKMPWKTTWQTICRSCIGIRTAAFWKNWMI